jgi:uncharacterized protein (DUF1501 family)
MLTPEDFTRRQFIGNACAAVGATGVLSALAQLRVMGAIAGDAARSVDAASGYKALVCVFLYGGSDANNVIIPVDNAGYGQYASQRTALAIPQANLLPISPKTYTDGRSYGLHPSLVEVQSLFAQGQLAFLANTGTLTYPVSLTEYNAGVNLPPQLFSHADQQTQWQSSVPDQPFQTGWGGRLADIINALNSSTQISMSISVAGQNSFQIGQTVSEYTVNPTGAVNLSGATGNAINTSRFAAQQTLLSQQESNLFQAAFANVAGSAVTDASLLTSILNGAAALRTTFPVTTLGSQLQMIARLISAAPSLGLKRQVFFASLGGFDTHTTELAVQGPLLQQVSQAMNAFYSATVELGVQNQVTAFTASDFSRTYNTNGNGADHGWGSHHMILGGAVAGGDIYGTMPSLRLGGPDDTGRGRWIPSTSVDEYAATLATWFGVSASNLPTVLPNIGRFATANLGFMAAS